MKTEDVMYPESLTSTLIAPCGMNCGLCLGYLRRKKRCLGCNSNDANKPKSCVSCRIKNCGETKAHEQKYCFECAKFPCARLRQLDKRYRTKYGMSMIENLARIRELGVEGFVILEQGRWKCPECGGVICVHRENCLYCGHKREL